MMSQAARDRLKRFNPGDAFFGYRRRFIPGDLTAAATLLAIAIPEQIATSKLAGMPPRAGLYAFIAGSIAIAIFGSTRQMSVGSDSTIAPIFAATISTIAITGTLEYQHLVSFVALATGILVLLAGGLGLGWVADLMSIPMVDGILAGIALEITVGQLPLVLGIAKGGTTTISKLAHLVTSLSASNLATLAVAVTALILVVGLERLNRKIPGPLVAVVVTAAMVPMFSLTHHHVAILGRLTGGLPSFALPALNPESLQSLLSTALTVAFVTLVQTTATARFISAQSSVDSSIDNDLVGVGIGSILASFLGSFAVDASPPRSAIVLSSGGKSQLPSLAAALVMIPGVLVALPLLMDLPEATLGAILLIIASRLVRIAEFKEIYKYAKIEALLGGVAFISIVILGIEAGVVTSIVISLAYRTRMIARPHDRILGREIGTDHWVDPATAKTESIDGIMVYLVEAPMWFGNAQYICRRLAKLVAEQSKPVRALVIDAAGIPDIDYTAIRSFRLLRLELQHQDIELLWARPIGPLAAQLQAATARTTGSSAKSFANVADAVTYALNNLIAPGTDESKES